MPHWIFVTCGTSITSSSRCWLDCGSFGDRNLDQMTSDEIAFDVNGPDIVRHLRESRESVFAGITDGRGFQEEANEAVSEYFRPRCFDPNLRHLLSAELATLVLMHGDSLIPDRSEILLLHGGPASNRRDAAVTKAVIDRLVDEDKFPQCNVTLSPALSWDPTTTEDFRQSFNGVWQYLKDRLNEAESADMVLTGGYKGLVSWLSFKLGTSWTNGPFIRLKTIYYLHEESRFGLITLARDDETGFLPAASLLYT